MSRRERLFVEGIGFRIGGMQPGVLRSCQRKSVDQLVDMVAVYGSVRRRSRIPTTKVSGTLRFSLRRCLEGGATLQHRAVREPHHSGQIDPSWGWVDSPMVGLECVVSMQLLHPDTVPSKILYDSGSSCARILCGQHHRSTTMWPHRLSWVAEAS